VYVCMCVRMCVSCNWLVGFDTVPCTLSAPTFICSGIMLARECSWHRQQALSCWHNNTHHQASTPFPHQQTALSSSKRQHCSSTDIKHQHCSSTYFKHQHCSSTYVTLLKHLYQTPTSRHQHCLSTHVKHLIL